MFVFFNSDTKLEFTIVLNFDIFFILKFLKKKSI